MTAPAAPVVRQSSTVRVIHVAMVASLVFFAPVAHFVLRPRMRTDMAEVVLWALFGIAVVESAIALFFRSRVPSRSTDESSDLFWMRATTPALVSWALFEMAGLMALVGYALYGNRAILALAGAAVIGLVASAPSLLERNSRT